MLVAHHARLSPLFESAEDGRGKWSKYLDNRFSEKSTRLIVAQEDGELVGFMLCLLQPNAPIFKERTIGVISDVYVNEERRRKGVAKEMLKVALRWFKKNRVRTVSLSVAAANFEARVAWGQLGFKPHMIHKRLDLDSFPASALMDRKSKRVKRRKVAAGRKA
jgi:ribosomal protein S18 acetylase RimI-like enzyme